MITANYREQVDLLLQIMPYVSKQECFALKGGTAINMFYWNMPRLSVDIDLTYLPFDDRNTALNKITEALHHIKQEIESAIPQCKVRLMPQSDGQEAKLICQTSKAQVKIEVNTTIRGHLLPPVKMDISEAVEDEFNRFVTMAVVSKAELFGGKICAALDRQHPRDIFDISLLYENGGITEDIRHGFIVALLSSPRPINEIIRPNLLDQKHTFETQFVGMTEVPFSYGTFEATREKLIIDINQGFSDNERNFLLSFKGAEPEWGLFPHDRLKDLPAVQWKLRNIKNLKKVNPKKHKELLKQLSDKL